MKLIQISGQLLIPGLTNVSLPESQSGFGIVTQHSDAAKRHLHIYSLCHTCRERRPREFPADSSLLAGQSRASVWSRLRADRGLILTMLSASLGFSGSSRSHFAPAGVPHLLSQFFYLYLVSKVATYLARPGV